MNNCIWCFIRVCNGENCRCKNFINIEDEEGVKISQEYEEEVKKVLIPLQEKFKEKYGINS